MTSLRKDGNLFAYSEAFLSDENFRKFEMEKRTEKYKEMNKRLDMRQKQEFHIPEALEKKCGYSKLLFGATANFKHHL